MHANFFIIFPLNNRRLSDTEWINADFVIFGMKNGYSITWFNLRPMTAYNCSNHFNFFFFFFFLLNFVLGECVDPYVFDNTSKTCFQLITDQLLNRSDADNYCKMDGGALVTIDTSEKQTALEGYLDSLGGKSGQMLQVLVLVFNVTFNNIPDISRRSNVTCLAA